MVQSTQPVTVKLDATAQKVLKVNAAPPANLPTRRYYIGVRKDSPLHYVTVGPMCFHKIVDPAVADLKGDVHRQHRAGQVVDLNDRQRELILKMVTLTGVRVTKTEAYTVSWAPDKNGVPHVGTNDESLARHVYMVELGDGAKPDPDWTDPTSDQCPEALAS